MGLSVAPCLSCDKEKETDKRRTMIVFIPIENSFLIFSLCFKGFLFGLMVGLCLLVRIPSCYRFPLPVHLLRFFSWRIKNPWRGPSPEIFLTKAIVLTPRSGKQKRRTLAWRGTLHTRMPACRKRDSSETLRTRFVTNWIYKNRSCKSSKLTTL